MKHELTAKRLKKALDALNMKPQELADKSGVGKSSISQYINGSHAPSNISSGKLGKILGVNPLWLMGFDVPMEKTVDVTPIEQSNIPQIMQYFNSLNDIGKREAEKRVEELTYIPQYTLDVKAAHNDHIDEDGELEKVQRDLSLLKRPD